MWVHWSKKLMSFTMNGIRIQLQGITKDLSRCSVVTKVGLKGLLNRHAVSHCIQFRWFDEEPVEEGGIHYVTVPHDGHQPPKLLKLLEDYGELFQSPTTLPPARPFDHNIQVLLGALLVNIRPYRYSPTQKDEIEKQLAEILQNGIIKHSDSPYASPVLLVRKRMAHGGFVWTINT